MIRFFFRYRFTLWDWLVTILGTYNFAVGNRLVVIILLVFGPIIAVIGGAAVVWQKENGQWRD